MKQYLIALGTGWRCAAAAVLVGACLLGCAARPAQAPGGESSRVATKVVVSSVLMSQDLKKLVVVTPGHHFVLDAPSGVAATLRSSYRVAVVAQFGRVAVDADGACGLAYRLSIPPGSLPEAAAALALEDGYRKLPNAELVLEGRMTGQRHSADVDLSDLPAIRLRQPYEIDVIESPPSAQAVAGASATPQSPIRRRLKDLLFIGTLPLFPLGIPMAILCSDGSCTR